MENYRIYPLEDSGRIAGPPHDILAEDDDQARKRAEAEAAPGPAEIWNGVRRVGQVPPTPKRARKRAE